ncbi:MULTISPECIES: GntR family transcriptional regulator [unclassified Nesterenkonia]|uniref:GntR family transcriptional regulator n=1 Tax=unclassified Nesterenkonia TaxID=2629769 RepID=UPI000872DCE9|nr:MULTISPECIES: GntR family transcriptional regulator [unclassified Nesterenkonia]MDS2174221.1 GntR family transcriptional regulator [Nesterenkonia sp. CL21]
MSIFTEQVETAVDGAYRWLRQEVTSLPWNQEAHLSESELARRSDFSRTPIREALLRLQGDGLIRRLPNRGVVVPALQQADLDSLMEVREVIEIWAARKAIAQGMDVTPLRDLLAAQEEAAGDPVEFVRLDVAFHRTIVQRGRNSVFEDLYEAHRYKQLRLGVQAVEAANRIEAVIGEHRAIVDAIASADPEAAAEATRRHLSSTARVLTDGR